MKNISLRGVNFFIFTLLIYGTLFYFFKDKTLAALLKSMHILLKILPIFALVIILTATINYFLNPKKISKYLGKDSGVKGWMIAIAGGVLSHGSMYAWYPMIEDLKKHGLKDGLIAAFFYSRAIKLPILPIMIDYFGLSFTIILSIYILIGSLLQGLLISSIMDN